MYLLIVELLRSLLLPAEPTLRRVPLGQSLRQAHGELQSPGHVQATRGAWQMEPGAAARPACAQRLQGVYMMYQMICIKPYPILDYY